MPSKRNPGRPTPREVDLLIVLVAQPWPVTIREAAPLLGVSSTYAVWTLMRGLEELGLAERREKGSWGMRATEAGRAYLGMEAA